MIVVDKLLEELLVILETLNTLFAELKEVAKAKQPILIKGTIDSLDNLTKKEQILVVQVGKLEERRYQIQQALANHFSVSTEELNVSFLMSKLTDNKEKFEATFKNLNKLMGEIKEINDSNSQLIQQTLDYIDYSMNLITSYEEKPTYPEGGSNSVKDNNYARIFDKKI